ncbi:hypothetical protein FIS3754_31440 [Fischerella sp. NIES-3754]|nr:hypothetical protein FIS3754_31440 [Fischerella sp. NIES-3754]
MEDNQQKQKLEQQLLVILHQITAIYDLFSDTALVQHKLRTGKVKVMCKPVTRAIAPVIPNPGIQRF